MKTLNRKARKVREGNHPWDGGAGSHPSTALCRSSGYILINGLSAGRHPDPERSGGRDLACGKCTASPREILQPGGLQNDVSEKCRGMTRPHPSGSLSDLHCLWCAEPPKILRAGGFENRES